MLIRETKEIIFDIEKSIDEAKEEILFQIFYVKNDETFKRIADKLINKAKMGVKIHILFDALGARDIKNSHIENEMFQSGIQIRYFNWISPFSFFNKRILYFRNHKRALIIDNKKVFIGGYCLGHICLNWHDIGKIFEDEKIINNAKKDFWNMYIYSKRIHFHFKREKKYIENDNVDNNNNVNINVSKYIYQAPLLHSRYIYKENIKYIKNAKKEIVFITPYFAPIGKIYREIKKIAKKKNDKKISIKIIIPQKSDHFIVDMIAKSYIEKLLKLNILIYTYENMIHAKAILYDRETLYIGSSNLDAISLRYNFENGVYTSDKNLISEFQSDIDFLISKSKKLDLYEWKKQNTFKRYFYKLLKIFRPFV